MTTRRAAMLVPGLLVLACGDRPEPLPSSPPQTIELDAGQKLPPDAGTADATSAVDPEDCSVSSLADIGSGAFPKVSPDGKRLAFTDDAAGAVDDEDLDYQVFVSERDGSGRVCLTCNRPDLASTRWRGQPYWHPSGEYLLFTAENAAFPRKGSGTAERPGIGRNHDVWLIEADGSKAWKLTSYPENWGVMRPMFSHDGHTLYMNEEFMMEKYPNGKPGFDQHPGCWWGIENVLKRPGEELCAWRVRLMDFELQNGEPIVSSSRSIDPPAGMTLLEASGFSADDQRLYYSYCDIEGEGGKCFWGDIYSSDNQGGDLVQLTSSVHRHDENAEPSPDGALLAYVTASGDGDPGDGEELFLMPPTGGKAVRLTHFAEPGHPEYHADSRQITELGWDPGGASLVLGHVRSGATPLEKLKTGPRLPSTLVSIDLDCSNARNAK